MATNAEQINKISEDVAELKTEVAVQAVNIKNIDKKLDEVSGDVVKLTTQVAVQVNSMAVQANSMKNIDGKLEDLSGGVKDIQKSLLSTVTGNNKFLKGWVVKLLALLIAGGVGGTAITSVVNAMTDEPPAVEKVEP